MPRLSKDSFNNINTLLSFLSALIAVVELCLHVVWYFYIITIGIIAVVWVVVVGIMLYRRPWYKQMRNPLICRGKTHYSFRIFLNTIFKKPYYESEFLSPKFSSKMDTETTPAIDTSRLTVVIEDDPVGYADNCGMLPCIPVDEEISPAELLEKLNEIHEEIAHYNFLFIATPSRRIESLRSLALNRDIGIALRQYFRQRCPEKKIRIISKIDSCLRSNYEAEYEGLSDGLGRRDCLEILMPSYIEQGRVTIHGAQYIKSDGRYVLMHESEYASFKGLEYGNSDLALWMEKRVRHIESRKNVGLIDTDMLRTAAPSDVAERIIEAKAHGVQAFVCYSSIPDDLTSAARIIHNLEERGLTLFLKLGPSMINRFAGAYAKPKERNMLSHIRATDNGIFIAGSLTSTTKKQIERYDEFADTSIVTIKESDLNNAGHMDHVIAHRSNNIIKKNSNGDDVILTTEYWKTDKNEYPDIQKRDTVLCLIAKICQTIRVSEKRWFLFKGSDTALYSIIHGLDIRHFYYCGQYIPGVIHCKCMLNGDLKSFFIVGGNVGTPSLLNKLRTAIQNEIGPKN